MIKIDISRLCTEQRPAIFGAFSAGTNNDDDTIVVQEDNRGKVKVALEKALPADYVVAENAQDPEELAILKRGDLEQLGLYFCSFCAMVFGSEAERNVHQRVHYVGFG